MINAVNTANPRNVQNQLIVHVTMRKIYTYSLYSEHWISEISKGSFNLCVRIIDITESQMCDLPFHAHKLAELDSTKIVKKQSVCDT